MATELFSKEQMASAYTQILDVLGPDWVCYDSYYNIGFRYTANNGQGLALPLEKTWYGATKEQKYQNPVTREHLVSIQTILKPLGLVAQECKVGGVGWCIFINRNIRRT